MQRLDQVDSIVESTSPHKCILRRRFYQPLITRAAHLPSRITVPLLPLASVPTLSGRVVFELRRVLFLLRRVRFSSRAVHRACLLANFSSAMGVFDRRTAVNDRSRSHSTKFFSASPRALIIFRSRVPALALHHTESLGPFAQFSDGIFP